MAISLLSCNANDNTVEAITPVAEHTIVDTLGVLHVKGTMIVDKNDNSVSLNGMSMFECQWGGKYYNDQCIQWLRTDWQCTVVRAACGLGSGGYLTNPQIATSQVMTVIDACVKSGIYVIVDWHDFTAQDHATQAAEFFTAIAKKYGSTPNIIYEIYNEPLNVSWSGVIKPYAEGIIKVIRQYDADNLIVVGTPNWSQDVDIAANDPITDVNLAYSLHFYTGTHRQSLRDKATTAMNKGLALFVTEYGISEASGSGTIDWVETDKWFAFVKEHRLSTCNWSVTDKDETSAALKPGANPFGNWSAGELSTSGTNIRDYIRSTNGTIWQALARQ